MGKQIYRLLVPSLMRSRGLGGSLPPYFVKILGKLFQPMDLLHWSVKNLGLLMLTAEKREERGGS